MDQPYLDRLARQVEDLRGAGLFKPERVLGSPQQPVVRLTDGRELVNLCANNYLALANHPSIREAAHRALDRYGYGMASVRFICGTQSVHKDLEARLSAFLGTDDTILYSSCFDANGGLFETLLDEQDAVISDALNHASIIDGIRLCKAQRLRYANDDMDELETRLKESAGARVRLVATDGVFSMDGVIARLKDICDLADRYGALVMVDDSHATGFVGQGGRGTPEYRDVMGRIDILTGTLGKALGGAAGGYTAARREIVAWLRQRSRPYLFSNTVSPAVVGATIAVFDLLSATTELRDKLEWNTKYFRSEMKKAGFAIPEGEHPICPIMLGQFENDAKLSQDMARDLLEEGIYVIGFFYPVVAKGKARIRVQLSAAHEKSHIDKAVAAFTKIGRKYKVIK